MRLICPNCDAQYEVDDNAIPKDGRDVQCSSCQQTWFQKPSAQLKQEEEAEAVAAIHKPDESVLEVLREEAEREARARSNETQGAKETQSVEDTPPASEPDPAQEEDVSPLAETVRKHMANPKEAASNPAQEEASLLGDYAASNSTGQHELPDIEELNSTLRAKSDDIEAEKEKEAPPTQQNRSSFRIGFGLVLTIAMLLLLAFSNAEWIIEKLPQSEPYMIRFVGVMNDLWTWLDQMMKVATEKMSGGDGA